MAADPEVVEEGLHVDPEGLVVVVDGAPTRGFATESGASDAGQDGCDDVVSQCEQGGDGAGGLWRDLIPPGPSGLGDQVLPADLTDVVGGLTDGVAGLPRHVVDLGCQVGDGETGCRGQRHDRGQGGADARLVQVEAADPGASEHGGGG